MIDLLRRLARRAPDGLTADCDQCGRPGVDVLRVSGGRMRCSCRSCGAVFRASALRLRPADQAGPHARPQPRSGAALRGFVPERMLAWLRATLDEGELVADPDRRVLYDWYARYDDFVSRARTSSKARARYDAVSDVALERLPERLPSFGHLVETLHATCYDLPRARDRHPDDPYVRERLAHAARWLASSGARYRWIDDTVEPPPSAPDRAAVRTLLEPGALDGPRDVERNRLLTGALFGTARGPSPSNLVAQFSAERVEQALRAYVEDGSRPLRAAVLANLRAAR